jgi:hypothetical protein
MALPSNTRQRRKGLFTAVIVLHRNKLLRFAIASYFHPCIVFVGKARAYQIETLMGLNSNGWPEPYPQIYDQNGSD